jgi:hypothetical protein
MQRGKMFLAGLLVACFTAPLFAEGGGVSTPTRDASRPVRGDIRRSADLDEIDEPAAPAKVSPPRIGINGTKDGNAPGLLEQVPLELQDLLAAPGDGTVTPKADFFGYPVHGKFVWLLDRSSHMGSSASGHSVVEGPNGDIVAAPSRMQVLKNEVAKVLPNLEESDMFAIVDMGG